MAGPKIRKGDLVQILSGKDRGRQGRVVNVWPKRNVVMVEGINQVKRHEKMRPAQGRGGMTGGIITKEMPIDLSNVAVVCGSCDKQTRVGYEVGPGGKDRVCKQCGAKL